MRRERREIRNGSLRQMIYISGGILALAVLTFVVVFISYSNKLNKDAEIELSKRNLEKIADLVPSITDNSQSASTNIGKTVEESAEELNEMLQNQINETKPEPANNPVVEEPAVTNAPKPSTESAPKTNTEPQKEEPKIPEFIMPVEGEILKEFAKDKLIESKTLQEWTTHPGIDIQADKTTVIKAAADGTVKSIKNDPRYGITVTIEHASGFTSVYANLLTAEFVVVGESVKSGQTIGTVGNTAVFEIADPYHLHFELLKDEEYVDPVLYLK